MEGDGYFLEGRAALELRWARAPTGEAGSLASLGIFGRSWMKSFLAGMLN